MKKLLALLLACMMLVPSVLAESVENVIVLSDEGITLNGEAMSLDPTANVYLDTGVAGNEDVAEELRSVENRVVTITTGGVYRISGTATDVQIAVKAGEEDQVRLILDGASITCSNSSAIAIYSAADPRVAGEYAVTIELADGSENIVNGSHITRKNEGDPKMDGAISSLISLGIEGNGALTVDADNEGIEVKTGHLTINGGNIHINSCDDPVNVSEDGVGVLTMNDGYLYSAVKNLEGCEGDGMDSNGWIVLNGGTAINLAHPSSMDSGIDSDMGSIINGGIVVGAGNMYDPIESDSEQLFMMLEFGQATDDLVVVTDSNGTPVFAYDFPYDYMYIAFSTPDLVEGETYNVYLGGEIEGTEQDGLYTEITSYIPGTLMQHGGGTAQQRTSMQMPEGGMTQDGQAPEMPEGGFGDAEKPEGDFGGNGAEMPEGGFDGNVPAMPDGEQNNMNEVLGMLNNLDLNELLKDADLNTLLADKDLNSLLTGFSISDLLTEEQIQEIFGDMDISMLENMGRGGFGGGMGGPRSLESSSDVATTAFTLTRESTGFTNVVAAE